MYTLGECLTESYPSEFGGPDTTRSLVVLWYGSFFRLSRLDPEFDWEGELWETLTHELQHHLESLAADDALVDMDYAADESYRRAQGEPFDPYFFRHGLPEDGWYRIEDEFYLEVPPPAPAMPIHFSWNGRDYEVDPPAEQGDVTYLVVHGVPDAPALTIVIVARRGWLAVLRGLLRRRAVSTVEADVDARPAPR